MITDRTNTQPFYDSEVPSDWIISDFGSVFTFISTFSFSREQLTDECTSDEIRYIHYGDIHAKFENEVLDFDTEPRIPYLKDGLISKEALDDEEFPLLMDGDLIIADVSEDYEGVGECVELKNVDGRKVISGLHTFAARDMAGKTVPGFRTYLLSHPQVIRHLRKIATGISVYGISKTNLTRVRLALPPLPEQKKIAEILSTWDKVIESVEKVLTAKLKLKKGLMQQLLTGKKRFQEFAAREWTRMKISDFTTQAIRVRVKPETAFLALGIRSHGKGTFLKPDFDPDKIEMTELYEVKENDLIVNITFAWEGAIAIAGASDDGALVSHRFPTYEFNTGLAIPEYFRHVIVQKWFVERLGLISPGGAGRNRVLSKKDFGKLEVLMPSVEEQCRIATVLDTCDKEIELLIKQRNALKEQKLGLMQQLLTGKKRIKVTEQEGREAVAV